MTLVNLPSVIHIHIANYLECEEFMCLTKTCKSIQTSLNPLLPARTPYFVIYNRLSASSLPLSSEMKDMCKIMSVDLAVKRIGYEFAVSSSHYFQQIGLFSFPQYLKKYVSRVSKTENYITHTYFHIDKQGFILDQIRMLCLSGLALRNLAQFQQDMENKIDNDMRYFPYSHPRNHVSKWGDASIGMH